MKTSSTLIKTTTVLTLGAIVLFSACSKTRDASSTTSSTASTPPADTSAPAATASSATAGTTGVDTWDSVKNFSYDQRSDFIAKTSAYTAELDAKAGAAKGDAKNRLAQARDDLRNAASELNSATAQTWDTAKERVGRAWQQAESAYRNAAE